MPMVHDAEQWTERTNKFVSHHQSSDWFSIPIATHVRKERDFAKDGRGLEDLVIAQQCLVRRHSLNARFVEPAGILPACGHSCMRTGGRTAGDEPFPCNVPSVAVSSHLV